MCRYWKRDFIPKPAMTILACGVALLGLAPGFAAEDAGTIAVVRSAFLGSAWNRGHAAASIVAQDGGFSYSVPGGTLWWFGDTFRGTRDAAGKPRFAGGGVSCSVARLDPTSSALPPILDFLRGADGTVAQAIAFLDGESWDRHRIWPLGGVYVNGKSFRAREIRFHTADEPYGPWSPAGARITVPERLQGKTVKLVYCAYFHPELFRERGRIMTLTFSLHLEGGGFDVNNEMVEVELARE